MELLQTKLSGPDKPSLLLHYFLAIGVILMVCLGCFLLTPVIGYQSVSLIFLLTVAVLPLFFRSGPVLLGAALSALLWNFLFIPPRFTFYISKLEDLLMFGMYFIIAIITGILTGRIRRQERIARYREERAKALYSLTRELSLSASVDEVINTASRNIKSFFNADISVFLSENEKLSPEALEGSSFTISEKEFGIANWAFDNHKKAGMFTETLSSGQAIYYPLSTPRSTIGVIGISVKELEPEQEELLDAFIYQISSSLEREIMSEKAREARLAEETEKLYTSLLNSLSHEFRTPLVTIMGAASSLIDKENKENAELKDELNQEIYIASGRLNRLIGNLLDMSRLEAGKLKLNLKWHDINELIHSVEKNLDNELKDHNIRLGVQNDLPLLKIDFGLVEQAISNILLNAAAYTPAGSEIEIKTDLKNGMIIIEISDNGPGLPEEYIEKVFEKFYRVPGTQTGGTGLGLSIVKGFIEAHHGTIRLENRETGGLRFIISLPS